MIERKEGGDDEKHAKREAPKPQKEIGRNTFCHWGNSYDWNFGGWKHAISF